MKYGEMKGEREREMRNGEMEGERERERYETQYVICDDMI